MILSLLLTRFLSLFLSIFPSLSLPISLPLSFYLTLSLSLSSSLSLFLSPSRSYMSSSLLKTTVMLTPVSVVLPDTTCGLDVKPGVSVSVCVCVFECVLCRCGEEGWLTHTYIR